MDVTSAKSALSALLDKVVTTTATATTTIKSTNTAALSDLDAGKYTDAAAKFNQILVLLRTLTTDVAKVNEIVQTASDNLNSLTK